MNGRHTATDSPDPGVKGRKVTIVTVFGSSRPNPSDDDYKSAYDIGKALALNGFILCNGGYGGTMEASARGASDNGGRAIGVIADYFRRDPNRFVNETVKVKTLADRLLKLVEMGDAYIILKGSTGTLLELSMVWEFMNKGVMREKPAILYGTFWRNVVGTLNAELIHEGLERVTKYLNSAEKPEECINILKYGKNL